MKNELNKFVSACVAKGEGEESGETQNDRRYYKTIVAVYQSLKSTNRLNELLELLEHENPYVRFWAASYTLEIDPINAEKVLEDLSQLKNVMASFSAAITLQEWRKGTLQLSNK